MKIKEIIARTQAASKLVDMSELEEIEIYKEPDSLDDYWEGSISQSYCNKVKNNEVRQA